MWVDHKCSPACLYKREAKVDLTGTRRIRWCEGEAERFKDASFEDWSNKTTSQEIPEATRGWKRLRTDSPTELPEEVRFCCQVVSDKWNWFQTPELWENTFLMLYATKFVRICYWKQIQLITHIVNSTKVPPGEGLRFHLRWNSSEMVVDALGILLWCEVGLGDSLCRGCGPFMVWNFQWCKGTELLTFSDMEQKGKEKGWGLESSQ